MQWRKSPFSYCGINSSIVEFVTQLRDLKKYFSYPASFLNYSHPIPKH